MVWKANPLAGGRYPAVPCFGLVYSAACQTECTATGNDRPTNLEILGFSFQKVIIMFAWPVAINTASSRASHSGTWGCT